MKYFGGLVLAGYAALMLTGWSPFSDEQRGQVQTGNVRRGPGGTLLWFGGFQGGK
ncbi:hypothetical protein [Pyxidicoccus xibeiensis]|uniref:hypothetical protein n=1 Tax=Pyxidicoccus xibeiensis TaxID=2906759 RepID=UPI0020A77620|nr:hypothetical protein [Pyxidicoccus xibeiensis]MCP3139110.1 hypothetical protein [Pyxidicoccus xibeiensis]